MTSEQWKTLLDTIDGKPSGTLPVGFIIDSPWLPNWYGISILDYFSNDELWLKANLHAVNTFPEAIFLPGFWSEYGMCSEPSAFGSRSSFPMNEFPHSHACIKKPEDIHDLAVPNPETDGMGPFILNRLKINRQKIEDEGHTIRFSVSRGPLNIASYLMGATEFLTLLLMSPEETHLLLRKITDYLKAWHTLQKEQLPTIDGIMMLDDILGFIAEDLFIEFALPYLKELYGATDKVKFLHCDTKSLHFLKYLPEIGINLFNPGFEEDLNEMISLTQNKVAMLGNIPPRDVLAAGTREDVIQSTDDLVSGLKDTSKIILSCGGGMPPNVNSENIQAFVKTVKRKSLGWHLAAGHNQ